MPKPKHASSYSLTPEAKTLLEQMAKTLGVPRNKVLELAIRRMAKRELQAEKTSEKNSGSH